MTSDLSKIANGLGPSAARLQLLIERTLELYGGVADMPFTEQRMALRELNGLLARITEAARDTADGIEALAGRSP
ncbi:hypothetical protein SAMN05216466_11151 [Paraburkholderia phenazinium]|uniref:Uncharacterized protein n=1 Tax=Paraburkholderia phenazinium TaxID=60549 RepID=A0A1G8DJE7_9BURK|nr:hypothetical protein [Paraburkholderia phenazinium]SDH57786.1 hypothetical protein SAMN05216466_11151 [Paraburkholderia phenazinium]